MDTVYLGYFIPPHGEHVYEYYRRIHGGYMHNVFRIKKDLGGNVMGSDTVSEGFFRRMVEPHLIK